MGYSNLSSNRKSYVKRWVERNSLAQLDVIKVKKRSWRLLDHYVVYMGQDEHGKEWFTANTLKGVQWLDEKEIKECLLKFEPISIQRFRYKTEQHFEAAWNRAMRCIGMTYKLLGFNCEHYANYVQRGAAVSKQADNFKTGVGVAAVAVGVGALLNMILKND